MTAEKTTDRLESFIAVHPSVHRSVRRYIETMMRLSCNLKSCSARLRGVARSDDQTSRRRRLSELRSCGRREACIRIYTRHIQQPHQTSPHNCSLQHRLHAMADATPLSLAVTEAEDRGIAATGQILSPDEDATPVRFAEAVSVASPTMQQEVNEAMPQLMVSSALKAAGVASLARTHRPLPAGLRYYLTLLQVLAESCAQSYLPSLPMQLAKLAKQAGDEAKAAAAAGAGAAAGEVAASDRQNTGRNCRNDRC